MSKGQLRKAIGESHLAQQEQQEQEEAFKYGDVFSTVSGELAQQKIAPKDAAIMQAAEARVLGHTQKGGPAAVMQSASIKNERSGVVGHDQTSDAVKNQGADVTVTDVPEGRIVTEFIAGQPVGQFMEREDVLREHVPEGKKITIGEALEEVVLTAGDKPVEKSDAAAIQAAETRATGLNATVPGGIAARALTVANLNAREMVDERKTKLGDILAGAGAGAKLAGDKVVDKEDAARVVGAELRNKADMKARPGGVAASVAAAAQLNQEIN